MYLRSPYPQPAPSAPPSNVHEFFFRDAPGVAQRRGDIVMHIDAVTGKKRTWREFGNRVDDAITALGGSSSHGGLGLEIGDSEMIGILSDNCLDYVVLVHALWALTIPFALISSHSTPFELEHSLRLSGATRLFVHPDALDRALLVGKKVGLSSHKIHILEGDAPPGRLSLQGMIDRARTNHIPQISSRPAGKDTLAYLVFSSGTSGLPKAVMISHGNIMSTVKTGLMVGAADGTAAASGSQRHSGKGSPPVNLAFLPMHHSYGLIVYAARSILGPTTLVITPRWDLDFALELIPRYRITHLNLIPSVVHQMVNSPKVLEADLSSLVAVHSGAAYLAPGLAKALVSKVPSLKSMKEGYGASETTLTMVIVPNPGAIKGYTWASGSCGVLVPGAEARILREDGSEADMNEPGELHYRGANVALGYYANEEATNETFGKDGWLRTGDRFRTDGINLFFEDRRKDTLKVSGAQVSPREIEDVLMANPDKLIVDAVVAGVSGGRTSDEKIPRAWVVLSPSARQDHEAVLDALKSWSQQSLSKYKWLRGGIEIVDEIPKNPTGKVLRRVLQDRYEKSLPKRPSRL